MITIDMFNLKNSRSSDNKHILSWYKESETLRQPEGHQDSKENIIYVKPHDIIYYHYEEMKIDKGSVNCTEEEPRRIITRIIVKKMIELGGGYMYMSKEYLLLKTISVMVNKDAIPKDILKKIKISL